MQGIIYCSDHDYDASSDKLRKIYRVETFIIPKNNKVYRSMETMDLEPFNGGKNPQPNSREIQITDTVDELKKRLSKNEEEEVENRVSNFLESRNSEVESELNPKKSEIESRTKDEELEKSIGGDSDSEKEFRSSDLANFEEVCENEEDPFLRFDYSGSNIERSQSYDFLPSQKSGSDLKSIMESSCEVFGYGSFEKICYHGNRNGCTVTAQSPSQVSEEIFKENWIQRLEFLRRRLSLIREKEVVLQERERLLLKKEKELRILERLVREKIQRADLYLKRCTRNSQSILDDNSRPSPPPYPEKPGTLEGNERNGDPDSREINAGSRTSNRSNRSKGSSGNSTRSELSKGIKELGENGNIGRQSKSGKNSGLNGDFKLNDYRFESRCASSSQVFALADFQRSKWSAYGSWKCRTRPKICYDDLDSTLSADIGDSSFTVTSKKLDPRLVQKPLGFARSASERRAKDRPRSLDLDADRDLENERVLRRISDNISAAVQSQGTRFQDYGSIDEGTRAAGVEREKEPYSRVENIETKNVTGGKDQVRIRKERSSFWNEEASDWLRKKRQAYNLATKRIANKDFTNDKENTRKPGRYQTSEKIPQRPKDEKGKKFTIFR